MSEPIQHNPGRHLIRRGPPRTLLYLLVLLLPAIALAQQSTARKKITVEDLAVPTPEAQAKRSRYIKEVLDPEVALVIDGGRSKLLRTSHPVTQYTGVKP